MQRRLIPVRLIWVCFSLLPLWVSCVEDQVFRDPISPIDTSQTDSLSRHPLVIEEIATGNVDFLDERGQDPGWVELANIADTALPLGAWKLRGSEPDGGTWQLPDTNLLPGQRILVFCSGLNRRRWVSAGDTVSAFSTRVYGWSDSMNEPPGLSSFAPWEIQDSLSGTLQPENITAFSTALTLRDSYGTRLTWSDVELGMEMIGGNLDVSGRDRLLLRATLSEGQTLLLRFCEDGQACWQGSSIPITGTGRRLDTYDLSLLGIHTDFSRLSSILFLPPVGHFGTYRFTVADVSFYRSVQRPHASFELHRKGGVLHLEAPDGTTLQSVEYPEMPATASWARLPATLKYVLRDTPTPEASNPRSQPATPPEATAFITTPGFYPEPVVVRLKSSEAAVVRCSKGGSAPGLDSPEAKNGFRLDSTSVLSCAAFDSSGQSGPVVSGLFLIGSKPSLPIISIIVDPVAMFDSVHGLYMPGPKASKALPNYGANFWEDTELPAHVELFEMDGRRGFSVPAGVGIFGNWSRAQPKRPLSIQFREKYGVRNVQWPLFPQHPEFKKFKGFGLRNMGGNYASGLSRDAFGTMLTEGRGLEYQLSRMVVVYINGKYWGMYDMREKLDADYLDTRFGLDEDEIDLLKNGGEVQAGTAAGWNDMVDWFMDADLKDSMALAKAATMLDLDNMATYLATEIWAANTDWPANNTRSWRRTSPQSPWRMMLFDLDAGVAGFGDQPDMFAFLGDSTVVDDYPNGPRSTVFFRKLSQNEVWRHRFINRLCALLATNFSPAHSLAVLDSVQNAHAAEKYPDAVRWKLATGPQRVADNNLRYFLNNRPAKVLAEMRAWYGLGDTVRVDIQAEGGTVEVEGFDLGAAYLGTHYSGVPIRLAARSAGKTFAGWSDGEKNVERMVTPGTEGINLIARFR
jgi:CotH kinase protein